MKVGLIVFGIILCILFIVFGPLVTIWSLNLLFGLHIPFTFWTWLASGWLSCLVASQCPRSSSK